MYKNILFPVDITEDENSWKNPLSVAIDQAKAFKAKLHIVTVVSDYGMSIVQQYFPQGSIEKVVERTKQDLQDFVTNNIPKEIQGEQIVIKGSVYECIIKVSKNVGADLIVMSAHRPELSDYLLGPNAAKVVRHSDKSVLVVRKKK